MSRLAKHKVTEEQKPYFQWDKSLITIRKYIPLKANKEKKSTT